MGVVKKHFAWFAVWAGGLIATTCMAQTHHSLGMDTNVTSTGASTDSSSGLHIGLGGKPLGNGWVTATTKDYSQKRKKADGIGIDVEIRNLSREHDSAKLEWYFFAQRIDGKGEDYLFDQGSEAVTLDPNSTTKFDLQSESLHSEVVKKLHTTNGVNKLGQHIQPSASVQKSGSKLAGWIVRLMVDGAPLIVKASSPSYETLGQGDPRAFRRKAGK